MNDLNKEYDHLIALDNSLEEPPEPLPLPEPTPNTHTTGKSDKSKRRNQPMQG